MAAHAPYQSWGRYPRALPAGLRSLRFRDQPLPRVAGSVLPFGNGRSYGDSCLNNGGTLLATRGLDRFLAFDPGTGLIRCEAGVLLSEILSLTVGGGWFLPVTPGTRYVTVGGAIANDVHGKNHHLAGTFGHQVTRLELLRSSGERLRCGPTERADLFAATIGGLGLTGLITWAEFRLKRIANPYVQVERTRFDHLDGFFELALGTDREHEYTVAWIDCLASGRRLGRGIYLAGNHAAPTCEGAPRPPGRAPSIPFDPPLSLIATPTLRAFNEIFYRKQPRRPTNGVEHFAPFFYPLDGIGQWNRIYGPKGFLQYQSVVPMSVGRDATRAMLECIAGSGQGSFLSVLKVFGDRPAAGLLSFPRPGVTLALDFPYKGRATLRLFETLDTLVAQAGGAIYPAKDAHMSPRLFAVGYPRVDEFRRHLDPAFSSSFWRRVTGAVA
ncbi:FAD-binding oxidoreductase [uncultured Thiodictyon sp.]|jgi:FAD/FMN-containing dehydrogenase|uniref:FAD-binding oxidoreductase n=1 Tax=uncultured Thiodictyon sp. TaxID=1846217 RepID=UPI0025FED9D1|nr:FAD-binding oxidoreductase [uncultured Thiodictyon sp.]